MSTRDAAGVRNHPQAEIYKQVYAGSPPPRLACAPIRSGEMPVMSGTGH
jgi:hypothetical protein